MSYLKRAADIKMSFGEQIKKLLQQFSKISKNFDRLISKMKSKHFKIRPLVHAKAAKKIAKTIKRSENRRKQSKKLFLLSGKINQQ